MRYAWLLGVLMLAGCAGSRPPSAIPSSDTALQAALTRHISVLASDEFGGREPGTEGEARTLRYLAREWQAAGLVSGTNDPANPWYAPVDLVMALPSNGEVPGMILLTSVSCVGWIDLGQGASIPRPLPKINR